MEKMDCYLLIKYIRQPFAGKPGYIWSGLKTGEYVAQKLPSGNYLDASPRFSHTFTPVSLILSSVSLSISHNSPGVSSCFLF